MLTFLASVFGVLSGEKLDTDPLTSDPVPFPPDDLVAPFVSKVTALPDYTLQDLLQPFLGGQGQAKFQKDSGLAPKDRVKGAAAAEAARSPTPVGGVKEMLMQAVGE